MRYFRRLKRRFPTLRALARASERDVLREWSGLGYYARARNLHRTARIIRDRWRGRIPKDAETLRGLPGIGPYTAGAIASIAYDRPEPALDGNQLRVLGRFLGIRNPRSGRDLQRLIALSRDLLRAGSPRAINQALMDLGGAVCLAPAPRCDSCPLALGCRSRGRIGAGRRPSGSSVRVVEMREALIYRRGARVWVRAPQTRGLLAGLWLPPLRPARGRPRADLVHAFSHRLWRIRLAPRAGRPSGDGRWVSRAELRRLPHSRLTEKILDLEVGVRRS